MGISEILKLKTKIQKLEDYAFFTFNPKLDDYFPSNSKPYDITPLELNQIYKILKICLKKNPKEIRRNINEYLKQCLVIINDKGEKEALIRCFCKTPGLTRVFQHEFLGLGDDGGDCRISVKINLTKGAYSELYVGGEA